MTEFPHPILKTEVHAFCGVGVAEGKWIARLYPYNDYPILFIGISQFDVEQKARDFIKETVDKYQQTYTNRKAAAEKLKEVRKKKV